MTVQGQSVSIPTGQSALSAIDTGTTLIGGPSDAVQAIWDAVPGHQALTGQMEGFFAFRECLPRLFLPRAARPTAILAARSRFPFCSP